MFRKIAAVLAVLAVVLLGPVPAASAVQVTAPVVAADDIPDIERLGGMSLRQKMLTVLGSLLRSDSGKGTSRAHFYSAFETGFSEDKLRRMMEYSTLNPSAAVPERIEDYVLQAHEFETPIKTDPKTGVKSFRLSPTAAKGFILGAGGTVLSIGTFVPLIGGFGSDVVGGWMGMDDTNREYCVANATAQASGDPLQAIFSGALGVLSARDCGNLFGLAPGFVPNSDAGLVVGELNHSGLGISLKSRGQATYGGQLMSYWCWDYSGSTSLPIPYMFQYANGSKNSVIQQYDGYCGHIPGSQAWTPVLPPVIKIINGDTDEVVAENVVVKEDPERFMECKVTLDDGTELIKGGATYFETSNSYQVAACPTIPEGRYATNVSMTRNTAATDSAPAKSETVYDEAATQEYQDFASTYPECMDGACLLDLRLKSGTKLGGSCFDLGSYCADWWSDPNKNDSYQCTYGAHDVSIDECAVYAGIFKPERVAVGAPYSDPMTGDWDGSSSAPRLDGQAMAQGIQNPADTRSCNGLNVTGFDPVGFVMRPIQCALEWAFVPRPLIVETELMRGEDAWDKKPPAVIAAAVANAAPTAAVEGCSRTVTIFQGQFQTSITPLDACPASWSAPLAAISKIATSALMAVLVFVVVRRQISGMVGYNQGQ